MNQDIREDLKAYLDGELDFDRAEQVRMALEHDAALREEAEFMKTLSTSFRSLRPKAIASAQMVEAAARNIAKPPRTILRSPWVWSGAAVILIAVVAMPILRHSTQMSEAERMAPGSLPYETAPAAPTTAGSEEYAPGALRDMEEGREPRSAEITQQGTSRAPEVPPILERNIIYTGELTVRVVNAEEAKRQVESLVRGWNGYVKSSTLSDSKSITPRVEFVVRVPSTKFDEAMSRFQDLGERVSGHSDSDDVTEQIVDIEARLRTMKAQEETYRQLLGQAKTVGQVIEVQDRLSALRGDIESLEARALKLKELSALSTIRLTLIQRPSSEDAAVSGGWASDAWASAVNGVAAALRSIATAAIFAFVWIPVWLPLSLFVFALYRRLVSPKA